MTRARLCWDVVTALGTQALPRMADHHVMKIEDGAARPQAVSGGSAAPDGAALPGLASIVAAHVDASSDLLIVWEPDGTVVHLNASATARLAPALLTGAAHLDHIVGAPGRRLFDAEVHPTVWASGVWEGDLHLSVGAPEALAVSMVVTGHRSPGTGAALFVGLARERTTASRRAALPTTDLLTGLATRAAFLEHLTTVLARRRRPRRPVAVLACDIDRFASVNASLGHVVGDQVLVALGRRLHELMRPGDVVARLGADEFAVLCEGVADESAAAAVAERVRQALAIPVDLDDRSVQVTVSVGIALAGDLDAEPVLRQAQSAMRRAKSLGRARTAVFDDDLRADAAARMTLEGALRGALERGELHLAYQPQYSLTSGAMVGAEALLRWDSPELGRISPAEFIPVAEESGLIVPIGTWVLREACRKAQRWTEGNPAAAALDMHVNLSPRQFNQPDLAQVVRSVLDETGLRPDRLCLEITETAVMDSIDRAADILEDLRRLGLKVGIDDFGIGYSSLGYLKRLPVDVLKLDKSFIDKLGDDERDTAIVVAVVNLARSLGLTVVAEGVETDLQRRELRALGCPLAQGYFFSPPVPEASIDALVAAG